MLAIGGSMIDRVPGKHASRKISLANEFFADCPLVGADVGYVHDELQIVEYSFKVNEIPRLRHALRLEPFCIPESAPEGEIFSRGSRGGRKKMPWLVVNAAAGNAPHGPFHVHFLIMGQLPSSIGRKASFAGIVSTSL